jgi:hypothetical protein
MVPFETDQLYAEWFAPIEAAKVVFAAAEDGAVMYTVRTGPPAYPELPTPYTE